jgi:broad specificity phosphatase PhoE
MAPKFIFIRHGEAAHNVAFHAVGPSAFQDETYRDAPLTSKGIQQVQEAAIKLSSYKILDMWCSPLRRCRQTAEELFEELSINRIYLHDCLLERQGGSNVCNERVSKEELQSEGIFDTTFLPNMPARWIEQESTTTVLQRLKMLILQLNDMYKEFDESYHILIVGHGDALGYFLNKSFANAEFVVMSLDEQPKALQVGTKTHS